MTGLVSPFHLSLLGPLRVLVDGQPLPSLRSRKSLWLLALLALRRGQPVERAWLAETLWPDAFPEDAAANLSPALSDLRRALGVQAARLQSPTRHTLRLDLSGVDMDVAEFDAAISSKTLPALEKAVALYTGPLLEGCAEEWAAPERDAREQDCLRALATLAETASTAGDFSRAADYSRQAVRLAPRWEAAQRGLMQALSQGGDINSALDVYQAFVRLLSRDDPRAAPDAETTALYRRLRAEARRRVSAPPAPFPYEAAPPTVTGYLPHPLTDLVGREDERLDVAGSLRRSRLVTLTGPGGIGKTRLALAVASESAPEFADGVWLVALDALSDGSLVPAQIARTLGLSEEADPTRLKGLVAHLRDKRLLLVLDNCEHLLDASAQVAGHLLQECADLRVLATSREALGITGETVWAVPSLAVPDLAHLPANRATRARVVAGYESVQLFVERAQDVQKAFVLTGDNAATVAHICARLGGIPLALEMAAVRTKALTVEQIESRLGNHLALLTGGGRGAPGRQQTLRATLDWSYSLLTDAERLLLARLSVFAGGWTSEAAERVCAGAGVGVESVLDLLVSLTDKSLIVFDESVGRYRFLETVRQYAVEKLHKSGGSNRIKGTHRDWTLALTQRAAPQLQGAEQEEWLKRLDEEHENLRTALDWAALDPLGASEGLQLANTLCHFWRVRGHFGEGRVHLRRALEHKGAQADTAERAKALSGLAMLATMQGDFVETRAMYEHSIRIYRKLGDGKGSAASLNGLGNAIYWLGDYTAAWAAYEESLGIFRERGEKRSMAGTLHNMGAMAHAKGEMDRSQAMYEESLDIFREQNDQFNIAVTLHSLGNLAYSQEQYTAARTLYDEGMLIARDLDARQLIAVMLEDFGEVDFSERKYASAQSLYEDSLSIHQDLGDRRGIAVSQQNLAKVAFSQGNTVHAKALYRESLRTFCELKYQDGVARSLKGLAAVIWEQEKKSVRLFGAAEALREKTGTLMLPNERAQYALPISQSRAALGDDAFTAAWAEGRALTWEQAAAMALEE